MNKYEQLSVAGEGAYGVVLKCKHKETGEIVAIKKFREPDDADEEAKRISQREVKLLRSLKHENIVELKEAFRQKGTLHLVFEYVEKSLIDILEASPAGVGADMARTLIYQLARALEHCHCHHVIHRDIKPDNLLLNLFDNSLRLCDFGSACKTSGNTVLTDYVATRWYRAPELLVSFNNYSSAVDVWGMGCVMVELTTGQPLFAGKSDLDQLCIIQKALGPLTSDQSKRCLELSNFKQINFTVVGERRTLRERFCQSLSDQQIQFLDSIIVVEPTQRLTAKAVRSTPWLRDAHLPPSLRPLSPGTASRTDRDSPAARGSARPPRPDSEQAARPHSQQSRGTARSSRPPSQPKPRVRRDISPCAVQGQGSRTRHGSAPVDGVRSDLRVADPMVSPRRTPLSPVPSIEEKQGMGIVSGPSDSSRCGTQESEFQGSVVSFKDSLLVQEQDPACLSSDPCEATIPEEIHDMQAKSPELRTSCKSVSLQTSRPSSRVKQRVRPASGRSMPSSSLTPMTT